MPGEVWVGYPGKSLHWKDDQVLAQADEGVVESTSLEIFRRSLDRALGDVV